MCIFAFMFFTRKRIVIIKEYIVDIFMRDAQKKFKITKYEK